MKKLVALAKRKIPEIARATKECPAGSAVVIVKTITGSEVKRDNKNRPANILHINFGSQKLTAKKVWKKIIEVETELKKQDEQDQSKRNSC